MQTMPHLALQPSVNTRPKGDFEEILAQAPLRRVEAKEFVFAEGDPTTHLASTKTVSRTFSKLKALGLIELPQSNRVKLLDRKEVKSLADGNDQEF